VCEPKHMLGQEENINKRPRKSFALLSARKTMPLKSLVRKAQEQQFCERKSGGKCSTATLRILFWKRARALSCSRRSNSYGSSLTLRRPRTKLLLLRLLLRELHLKAVVVVGEFESMERDYTWKNQYKM